MKRMVALLLLLLSPAALFAQPPRDGKPRPLVFVHVTVIDPAGGTPSKAGMSVVIVGDRITEVGKSATVRVPKGAQVVDATGKFLIPGLWDMHVHTLREERVAAFLPLFIANGVTGVRDMGMPLKSLELLKRWRQEIQEGTRVGPRIFASGPTLGGARAALTIPAKTEAEARQAILTLKQGGADFIKVYSLLPRQSFFAAADEAKKQGLTFAGHVPVFVSAAEASDAGQKSMEHLYGLLEACSTNEAEVRAEVERAATNPDTWAAWGAVVRLTDRAYGRQAREKTYSNEKCEALFARFVRNRTWQCPTLVMRRALAMRNDPGFTSDARLKYVPPSEVSGWNPQTDSRNRDLTTDEIADRKIRLKKESELVGRMHRAGVEILAGTDLGNPYVLPGFSLHDELVMLVEAGLTPMDALRAATINAARFLGTSGSLGTIERGKLADLVLLDADPLADIRNTQKISAVVANGRLLDRRALDGLLAAAAAAAGKK